MGEEVQGRSQPQTPLDYARKYIESGVSLLPIGTDGEKQPAFADLPRLPDASGKIGPRWGVFRSRFPTEAELLDWFGRERPLGMAGVCGPISGGLECLDFDGEADSIFAEWADMVEERSPGLFSRLCVVVSPRNPPGRHVWYRSEEIEGSKKLARRLSIDEDGDVDVQVLIETKGDGGYAILPGSPAYCHKTGKPYLFRGEQLWEAFTESPIITAEERRVLHGCAGAFDKPLPVEEQEKADARRRRLSEERAAKKGGGPKKAIAKVGSPSYSTDISPGSDFDLRGPDWSEILESHGIVCVSGSPFGVRCWRRAGKTTGHSMTTGHCFGKDGAELLHVFSTSAHPLDVGDYGKFRALAALEYGNGALALSACAKDLAAKGYGSPKKASQRVGKALFSVPKQHSPVTVPPLPSWRSFPVESLPRPLRDLAVEGAKAMGCDPAYFALPALGICAAAIGNSRLLQLKRGWCEPSVLWAVTVGESGTLKTPPYRACMKPLYAQTEGAAAAHKKAMVVWEGEHENWKIARRDAIAEGKTIPLEPERPRQQRAFVGDITVERLAEILEDSPRGVLVTRDELSGWFGSFTKYKNAGAGSDCPNWLETYQAGVITVDRKTGDRRSVHIKRAAASVMGGIQPGILARCLTPETWESGLAARLLVAWPPKRKKVWSEDVVPEAVENDYARLVRSLLALPLRQTGEEAWSPHVLHLTSAAKRSWIDWYGSWADVQYEAEGEMQSCYSKIEAVAARLALVHHVCSYADVDVDDLREIQVASMNAGVTLARWFAAEAERVYGYLRVTEDEQRMHRLLEWVERHNGRVSARDLSRTSRRYASPDVARAALDELVNAGLGTWEEVPPTSHGGRPTAIFVVCCQNAKTAKTSETLSGGDLEAG